MPKPPMQPISTQTNGRRMPSRATIGRTSLSPISSTAQPSSAAVSAVVDSPCKASCSASAATAA
jgi:hypothetical protein